MKSIISYLSLIVVFLGFQNLQAQDLDLIEASKSQKDRAHLIVTKLNDQLSLTEKQYMLFHEKQTEFIAKNDAVINSDRTPDEANKLLRAFYKEQYQEMDDILTEPQMQVYREIRPVTDPLITVSRLQTTNEKMDN
ncbi:hypothetical protein [Nonlabens xiamenensis]|uniref:hypothetical protein n=1 Tax=Nonlabens xiamenensis TaxID=2341043 RepID=UPI000F60544F|nr:hypothetical protein [Nonlabens xiamenensis]